MSMLTTQENFDIFCSKVLAVIISYGNSDGTVSEKTIEFYALYKYANINRNIYIHYAVYTCIWIKSS